MLLGDFLQDYDNLVDINKKLSTFEESLHDESQKLVDIRESLRILAERLRELRRAHGKDFIESIKAILETYPKVSSFVSDNAKKGFIEFIIEASLERAEEYFDRIIQMLLEKLSSEREIIGYVLAKKIRNIISKRRQSIS